MVWLEGRGAVPGTRHGLLPAPRHNACLTPIPAQHSPSATGLCPAAAQAGKRQRANLSHSCPCCAAAAPKHPQIGSGRHSGARFRPYRQHAGCNTASQG